MRNHQQGEGFPYYLATGILFLLLLFGVIAPINKAHDFKQGIRKQSVSKKARGKAMLYYGYHLTGPVGISGDYIENGITSSGVMSYYNSAKGRYLFYIGSSTGYWLIHDTPVGGAGQYQSPYGAYYNNMPLTGWVDYGFEDTDIVLVGFSLSEPPAAPELSGLSRLNEFNAPELVVYGGSGTP